MYTKDIERVVRGFVAQKLDIEYIRSIGFRTDMKIIVLTIPAVLAHKGY